MFLLLVNCPLFSLSGSVRKVDSVHFSDAVMQFAFPIGFCASGIWDFWRSQKSSQPSQPNHSLSSYARLLRKIHDFKFSLLLTRDKLLYKINQSRNCRKEIKTKNRQPHTNLLCGFGVKNVVFEACLLLGFGAIEIWLKQRSMRRAQRCVQNACALQKHILHESRFPFMVLTLGGAVNKRSCPLLKKGKRKTPLSRPW